MTREDKQQAWRYELARQQRRFNGAGVASVETIASMSGFEFLNAIAEGLLGYPPIGDTLNFYPLLAEKGRVIFQGEPKPAFYNPIGSVHGGWACTLLDSCVACAVQTMLPKGRAYTTVELKVNMLRPILADTGPLRAEGKVVQVGRQIGVAEGRLYDVDDKLYGFATTTCLVFDVPVEQAA